MGMRWWLRIGLVLIAVALGLTVAFTTGNIRPNIDGIGSKSYNKGTGYPEILISAFLPGPIQDDLKKRGLLTIGSAPNDSNTSVVDSNAIQQLINAGIYFIDPQRRLELGPITLPGEVQQLGNAVYRYAQRRTQTWGFLDNFNFTGLDVQVNIPESVDINSGGNTTHNLYCIHLTLLDGRWVESGVGWVNWTTSPIIYTYQSYTGQWTVASIPGGQPRDINLRIQIGANRMAEMYAFDALSNKSVSTTQEVGGLDHVVDFAQEQHSRTNQWVNTQHARFHDAKVMSAGTNQWVNWDSRIAATWIQNPPMYAQRDTTNGQNWTETWCSPNQ
jgi:hypothetical protein